MVLIISSEDDISTNDVIDWLIFYKIPYLRISHLDDVRYNDIIINNTSFEVELIINNVKYKLTQFKAFWYRRSFLNMTIKAYKSKKKLDKEVKRHLENEAQEVNRLVKKYIEKLSLNKHNDIFLNKLEVLKEATEIGLLIPKTIITDNKKKLIQFYSKNKQIISKNFSPGIFIRNGTKMLGNSTKLIDEPVLNSIPEKFHYMLFQECIDKLFEVRVFFVKNIFYSSAIFSQNNEKTKLDFRNYDFENLNRTPPFILPNDIQNKIIKLMNRLNINSGSVDLIVSKKNEYVFLEVNPIGQFSQVSIPCNYYIEKQLAIHLRNQFYETL